MQISFNVKTKEIKKAFQQLFIYNKKRASSTITIIVEPDNIELKVPGITQRVVADGDGMADVILPANALWAYLQTASASLLSFTIRPGELEVGGSIYSHKGITIVPSPVERSADVPLNLNPYNVLRFTAGKTSAEIKELGLVGKMQYAKIKMHDAITTAAEHLKEYNVKFEDIYELVERKLKYSKV